jgi:hypothetical protein
VDEYRLFVQSIGYQRIRNTSFWFRVPESHDHQHVPKRLFAETQKLSFYVSVDNWLPRPFLHWFDLWSGLDHLPFLGISENPPQRAESVVVLAGI